MQFNMSSLEVTFDNSINWKIEQISSKIFLFKACQLFIKLQPYRNICINQILLVLKNVFNLLWNHFCYIDRN